MRAVTELLEHTAERCPNREAFRDEKRAVTFDGLRTEAYRIADAILLQGFSRGPVLILLEKSVECIAAFLGVAYSGNFYTPADTKMPRARLEKIVATLEPRAIITDDAHEALARELSGEAPILLYEEMQQRTPVEEKIRAAGERIVQDDPLYVLFTSGSTGEPKGVVISHRAALHYTKWMTTQFSVTENDVLGNEAPLYFDLSIQDVYAPLAVGCRTVLIDRKHFAFPAWLMSFLLENQVTTIMWVPSMLCMVANLKGLNVKKKPELQKIFFCGEVMPNKQLNLWRQAYPDALFVNFYGPTEACDACGYFIVDREFSDDEPLPIGFPAPNTEFLLLDEEDRPVTEPNTAGELCIRGTQLSDGYYNDAEKTKQSFVQDPRTGAFPEIIYRTGDLAAKNERGELMYLSRKDFQIKHLGHRIELGEIETAASSLDGVDQCCCLYDKEEQKIVLFYTGNAEEDVLLAALNNRLPQYMVPGKRVRLRTMPHNANGKIDRNELKESL